PSATFNQWIQEGHCFTFNVQQSAIPIYTTGNFTLPVAVTPFNKNSLQQLEQRFQEGMSKAKAFFRGAAFFCEEHHPAIALFMLHQSAEQALHVLVKTATGYHSTTHN